MKLFSKGLENGLFILLGLTSSFVWGILDINGTSEAVSAFIVR